MRAAWTDGWGPSLRCRCPGVSPLGAPSEHDHLWQPVVQKACNKDGWTSCYVAPFWHTRKHPCGMSWDWTNLPRRRMDDTKSRDLECFREAPWLSGHDLMLWPVCKSYDLTMAPTASASGAKRGGLKTSATKNLLPCFMLWGSLTALRDEQTIAQPHSVSPEAWNENTSPLWGSDAPKGIFPFEDQWLHQLTRFPPQQCPTEFHNGPCFPSTGICAIYEPCFTHVCRGPGDVSDGPDWVQASSGCSAERGSMGLCSFSGTWSRSAASFTSGTKSLWCSL